MRKKSGQQTERSQRGNPPEPVITLLAAAGLRAELVKRCPDPACPLCPGGSRAAA